MTPPTLLRTLLGFGIFSAVWAAELPPVPPGPIAEKKDLLFSDDFQGAEPSKLWHRVVASFAVTNGALKGTQTRDKDVTGADGKVTKAHAAVHGLELPTRDSVLEVKIRFEGAAMIDVEFDDRKYTNAHYGHLCRAQFRTNGVTIIDERDGGMRNDIRAMAGDPARAAERAKLLLGRQITYPFRMEPGKWHAVAIETAGGAMRVSVNGAPAAYLNSSGIGHPTKSKLEFGVAGKDGFFDDLKIWNASPAAAP